MASEHTDCFEADLICMGRIANLNCSGNGDNPLWRRRFPFFQAVDADSVNTPVPADDFEREAKPIRRAKWNLLCETHVLNTAFIAQCLIAFIDKLFCPPFRGFAVFHIGV